MRSSHGKQGFEYLDARIVGVPTIELNFNDGEKLLNEGEVTIPLNDAFPDGKSHYDGTKAIVQHRHLPGEDTEIGYYYWKVVIKNNPDPKNPTVTLTGIKDEDSDDK